ncbi:hypothetical protein DFH06DRAFT_1407147 [Mycena polygramma]|nr:hypothetical protein DFH06DRAFT_1407147 [Mycena polygramma]
MHRFFEISELRGEMFAWVDPSHLEPFVNHAQRSGNYKTLSALARTCKAFQADALDRLWREQNVVNVVRTLPPERWEEEALPPTPDGYTTRLRLRGPIQSEDWLKPRLYARRIKRLAWPDRQLCRVDLTQVFPAIPRGMFPENLALFLNPRLHCIELVGSDTDLPSFLKILASRCPALAGVSVISTVASQEMSSSISAFVCSLTHVTNLWLDDVDRSTLMYLARLPSLKVLTLDVVPTLLPNIPEVERFAGLHRLSVCADKVLPVVRFLAWSSPRSLAWIAFRFTRNSAEERESPVAGMSELYSVLPVACDHSSVVVLHVALMDDKRVDDRAEGPSVHPLLVFANLSSIVIGAGCGFAVDDEIADEMARAWPSLTNLRLLFRTRATLRCLRSFAHHCPRLIYLHMSLDASSPPPPPHSDGFPIQQTSLHEFNPSRSAIESPVDIARFLSRLFPGLTKVACDPGLPQAHLWKTVESHLPSHTESDGAGA